MQMLEAELERIITFFPDELIGPGFHLFSQQEVFQGGRTDLIFRDAEENLLVIEIKAGTLTRSDIGQIVEYWPRVKARYPGSNIQLMVIASEIPYEKRAYLENFDIQFREIPEHLVLKLKDKIPQGEGALPQRKRRKPSAAIYKEVNTVSRGLVSLSLKFREDLNYYTSTWRQKRPESGINRQRYKEKEKGVDSFWSMPADIAHEMLDEAHARGLFLSQYFRWPGIEPKVLDTAKLSRDEGEILIDETLTTDALDQMWRNCDDLRIVACCEPVDWIWRKIAIFSARNNLVTFRSMTLSDTYRALYTNLPFKNGWKLDRSMMDADVSLSIVHLEALKELFGNT